MGEIRKIEAVERGMMRDKEIFFSQKGKLRMVLENVRIFGC